ncbi:hypothetical protein RJ641_021515 [Dillenia turbinata]|uniref:Uncharacterized protein n=1 Tax=Dillenia turbinata TaxID=194707 RepID=A0AAN8UK04_9MAGN
MGTPAHNSFLISMITKLWCGVLMESTTNRGMASLLLTHYSYLNLPSPIGSSLSHKHNPKKTTFFLSRLRYPLPLFITHANFSWRKDSNAEFFNTHMPKLDEYDEDEDDLKQKKKKKKKKRRWWSDKPWYDEEDQDPGLLEQVIDNIWIFKVFSSYGWFLPFIIVSMLLATGPKAFLLALVIPVGQSVVTLTIEKLWDAIQKDPNHKAKVRRKKSTKRASKVKTKVEEQEETQGARKGKMGYNSWAVGAYGSTEEEDQEIPSFGGWDELDRPQDYNVESMRRPTRIAGGPQRKPMEGRLSRRQGQSDTPLLLRLLIAAKLRIHPVEKNHSLDFTWYTILKYDSAIILNARIRKELISSIFSPVLHLVVDFAINSMLIINIRTVKDEDDTGLGAGASAFHSIQWLEIRILQKPGFDFLSCHVGLVRQVLLKFEHVCRTIMSTKGASNSYPTTLQSKPEYLLLNGSFTETPTQ